MKRINVSIIINIAFILFLFTTFFLQYEHLFLTRIASIAFSIVYLLIELKKEYFSANRKMFIILSVASILVIIVSILFDNTLANSVTNNRAFFVPVYVFILIVIVYKDLYDENK